MRIYKNTFYSILFIIFLFSCKSEKEKIAERNAVVDSTVVSFEKNLYKNQIDSVFAKDDFNGRVAIFNKDEIVYQKQNGFQNFEKKIPFSKNSVFAIGSVSKQFTAVLVLLQEEQGKLKTSDKVSKYLQEFNTKDLESITIHQLLNHSSGLNDDGEKLLFKSGTDFNYSNKGFRFLGKIIEKVSGKSYEENAKGLFEKAGMTNTSTANTFNGENFAGAYVGNPKNFHKIEGMPKRLANKEIGVPAGGILSTVRDLEIWNNALFGGKILKPESLQKMLTKSATRKEYILGEVGYCYGIMTNLEKQKIYFHSGYIKGSPSFLAYYPETKTSVIVLSNLADENLKISKIFKYHIKIKKIADSVENAALELRKEMSETLP